MAISTSVDFAYYVVHPKAKARLPQVKAFVAWILAEGAAHETAMASLNNGAWI
jgi:LysR family glycine cleavage system transcriptional activator